MGARNHLACGGVRPPGGGLARAGVRWAAQEAMSGQDPSLPCVAALPALAVRLQ